MTPEYSPIAIVGLGCRFPGGANSPEQYWKLLTEGRDAIQDVPADRWNQEYFHAEDRTQPGALVAPQGGFIDDIRGFDAQFFGIPKGEAANMDPQQRLLLQVAWEAMEHGGIAADRWAGQAVGVFMGCFTMDYHLMQFLDPLAINAYTSTGIMNTMLANRLSHAFDFRGPSMSIDTACSASLTAVHQAAVSLQRGESDMALAGGVMLMMLPDYLIAESKTGFLSKDGRCKSFSESANGYVRSEGVGVVVLKRLADAIAAGDQIQGVIIGSAVNQDGRTPGITVPSAEAQMAVMRRAQAVAGITGDAVRYVEAHGTGTPVGDPIEARAIGQVFRLEAGSDQPLWIGSCKSNIGHTEAAAGVAGLIKTVLCLQHRQIPANLHVDPPSPAIPFDKLHLQIPRRLETLALESGPLVAGVNSFGFGGANAHVLVQAFEATPLQPAAPKRERPMYLLPLSAQSDIALRALAGRHAAALGESVDLNDWCTSAAHRRAHLNCRKGFVAQDRAALARQLATYSSAPAQAPSRFPGRKKLVWIFPGVGQLRYGMSRYWSEREAVFRETYLRCDAIYREISGLSLLESLAGRNPEDPITECWLSHPENFFYQVSLSKLWRSWGLKPDAIVGHSAGEFAGFYEAGIFDLRQSLEFIFRRVEMLRASQGRGAMLAVNAGPARVQPMLQAHNGHVRIGAYNSPEHLTVSGEVATLQSLALELKSQAINTVFLDEPLAYHHPGLIDGTDECTAATNHHLPAAPRMPVYSTVTGDLLQIGQITPDYWARNLLEPVQFQAAIENLAGSGSLHFVELSGKATLLPHIHTTITPGDALRLNSATVGNEEDSMMTALANLYEAGFDLDWEKIHPPGGTANLPRYPWQQEPFWQESEVSSLRRLRPSSTPLLGTKVREQPPVWEALYSTEKMPWLAEHVIMGECVLPGAVSVCMAVGALSATYPGQVFALEGISFDHALRYATESAFFVRLELRPEDRRICIRASKELRHTDFKVLVEGAYRPLPPGRIAAVDLDLVRQRLGPAVSGQEIYRSFQKNQYQYGPGFQGIETAHLGYGEAWCVLHVDEKFCGGESPLHPVAFDCVLQAALTLTDRFELPIGIDQVRVFGRGVSRMHVHALRREQGPQGSQADLFVYDSNGRPILSVLGLRTRSLQSAGAPPAPASLLSQVGTIPVWERLPAPDESFAAVDRSFVLLADRTGLADRLADGLREAGQPVTLWQPPAAADSETRREALVSLLNETDEETVLVNCLAADGEAWHPSVCEPLIDLAFGIQQTGFKGRIWNLTMLAQQVAEQPSSINLPQAALWGMARVFGHQEFPENWGGLIDLSSLEDCRVAAQILSATEWPEDQLAVRDGQRYALRLHPHPPSSEPAAPPSFSPHGVYMVTGAFGGLGRAVVQWMVEANARQFVLTTIRAVPARSDWMADADFAWLDALERQGLNITVLQMDLRDPGSIQSAIAGLSLDRLRGVMYCAGVVEDELLPNISTESFQRVMEVKALGATHLHLALREAPLEHFVLFSSIGSLLPIRGMGSYAAANAVLDALAQQRWFEGLPAMSLNWGPWSAGMAAQRGLESMFTRLGMIPFTTEQGIAALEAAFHVRSPQIALLQADWPVLLSHRDESAPLFRHFQPAIAAARLPVSMDACDPDALEQQIKQTIVELLNITTETLDTSISLRQYGLDSVAAMMLGATMIETFGVKIPIGFLLDEHPIDDIIAKVIYERDSGRTLVSSN